jgi:RES domain-containing protein
MEVFKIAREIYANDLVASGRANRWNIDDQYVMYTASSRSLATLELFVSMDTVSPSQRFKVMVVSIADDDRLFIQIPQSKLPLSWRTTDAYPELRNIGNEWYQNKTSLVLKVPSAVIPQEYNYVINTLHPDFKENVSLVRTENYLWDKRLF